MKTVKLEFNLYTFDELSKQAQNIALWTAKNDYNDTLSPEEINDGQYLKTDEDAREYIEANEYYFYERGNLAHVIKYVGGEKDGEEFYIYEGREIRI